MTNKRAVRAAGALKQLMVASVMLMVCVGCGRKEDSATETTAPATERTANTSGASTEPGDDVGSTATVTTGVGVQQADNQVEFYTERYLSADERLKRRQERLGAVLLH